MKWWQTGKRNADLERELQSDLELEEEEQRERGIAPEEARYAALRAFGNPSVISEQTREVWSWDRLDTLLRDLKISIRALARQPGFSAVANVGGRRWHRGDYLAVPLVVWSVLLKPLPFDRPGATRPTSRKQRQVSGKRRRPRHLRRMETREVDRFPISRSIKTGRSTTSSPTAVLCPKRSALRSVLGEFLVFDARRPSPASGTLFSRRRERPAIFRQWYRHSSVGALWKRRFGGDSLAVIGCKINLDAKPYTVIGVMPRWFAFPEQKVQIFPSRVPREDARGDGQDRQPRVQGDREAEAWRHTWNRRYKKSRRACAASTMPISTFLFVSKQRGDPAADR